jgi:1-deoxy-D-xylulose-5-phosphate reductoisomerase
MTTKKIAILGSTGSIGTQALDIIEQNPDLYSASVLSCSRRINELKEQIDKFHPELVVVEQEKDALELAKEYGVDVPMNTMLYRQIKTIEASF